MLASVVLRRSSKLLRTVVASGKGAVMFDYCSTIVPRGRQRRSRGRSSSLRQRVACCDEVSVVSPR